MQDVKRGMSLAEYMILKNGEDWFWKRWSDKNIINPYDVTRGNCEDKIWIICEDNQNHIYEQYIANFTKGIGCPYCSGNLRSLGFSQKRAGMRQTLFVQHADGALHARITAIKDVIVGGGDQIDPRRLHGIRVHIGRIEAQMGFGIACLRARQRRLQIADHVIRFRQ